MRRIRILEEASDEAIAAAAWYDRERPGLGIEFEQAVDAALDLLERTWRHWCRLPGYPERRKPTDFFLDDFRIRLSFPNRVTLYSRRSSHSSWRDLRPNVGAKLRQVGTPPDVDSSDWSGVIVLALLRCQPLWQLDSVSARYGKHGALRKAAMHLPVFITNLPILDVVEVTAKEAVQLSRMSDRWRDEADSQFVRAEDLEHLGPEMFDLIRATDETELYQSAPPHLREPAPELLQRRASLRHGLEEQGVVRPCLHGREVRARIAPTDKGPKRTDDECDEGELERPGHL